MNTHHSNRHLAIGAVALALLVACPGSSPAETTRDFPGGSPLIIPAAAFNNTGFNPTASSFNTTGYIAGGSSPTCFVAPVYLPDGARVTRLIASLVDMSSGDMMLSLFFTQNTAYRTTGLMASLITNGNTSPFPLANSYGTSAINFETVTYPERSYFLFTCLNSFAFQLHDVEIRYLEELVFRDGFESDSRSAAKSAPWLVGAEPEPATAKNTPFGSPLNIAGSEFKPDGFQAGDVLISFVDGAVYGANYAATRFVHAPIYLPDGASITDLRARVLDDDEGGGGPGNCASGAPSDMELTIVRKRGCSGASCSDQMARVSSSGAASFLRTLDTSTIDFPVVDGEDYGYFALVRLCGPKHELHNLRVYYSLP